MSGLFKHIKTKQSFILIAATALVLSCAETIEDIGLPELPPPVVVSAYLYPGMKTIQVYVHKAHSLNVAVIAENMLPVEGAMVSLMNDNFGNVGLSYSDDFQCYELNGAQFPIESGQNYELTVQIAGHPLIEASVLVPFPHEAFGIEITGSTETYLKEYFLRAFINDPQGQKNHYQLFGKAEILEICNTDHGVEAEVHESRIFDYSPLFADENRDGQTIHQSGYFYMSDKTYPYICTANPQSVYLKLVHFESFTYQYLLALEDFYNAHDNPFAEHVIVPSNLTNAEGVFGAYAVHEKTILWDELE